MTIDQLAALLHKYQLGGLGSARALVGAVEMPLQDLEVVEFVYDGNPIPGIVFRSQEQC